jgi:[ribosomal protein S5]-alanine N-acetyltransferase
MSGTLVIRARNFVACTNMVIDALSTPSLIIRDVRASDAAAFHAYMQHEDYWRDLPMDSPSTASVARMVDRWLEDQTKQPRSSFVMAATDKVTGKVVGEAIFHIRSQRWQQGEIGWGISSNRAGHGLGTEIGHAMLRLAFGKFHLHRVYAQCRVENRASRRIMEKLGMREEGILRENVLARGTWWSSVQCSILTSEYVVQNS